MMKVRAEVSGAIHSPPELVVFELRKKGRPKNEIHGEYSVREHSAQGDVLVYEREIVLPPRPGDYLLTVQTSYEEAAMNVTSKAALVKVVD